MSSRARPVGSGIGRSRLRLLDGLVVVWMAAWVAVGVWVGIDVHHLDHLATTLASSGQALSQTAQVLNGFTHLPLVGHNLAAAASHISTTAQGIQHNAAVTKHSVEQLSYLLAVVIAVIPSVPVLAAYLPFRLGWLGRPAAAGT